MRKLIDYLIKKTDILNIEWVKGEKMKLIKRIIEAILFVFAGNLIRIAFTSTLIYVENIILFIGAILIIIYIELNNFTVAKNAAF